MASEDVDETVANVVEEDPPVAAAEKGEGEGALKPEEVVSAANGAVDVAEVEKSVDSDRVEGDATASAKQDPSVGLDNGSVHESRASEKLVADDESAMEPESANDGASELESDSKNEELSGGVDSTSVEGVSEEAAEVVDDSVPKSVESEILGDADSSAADETAPIPAPESTEVETPALVDHEAESPVDEEFKAHPDVAGNASIDSSPANVEMEDVPSEEPVVESEVASAEPVVIAKSEGSDAAASEGKPEIAEEDHPGGTTEEPTEATSSAEVVNSGIESSSATESGSAEDLPSSSQDDLSDLALVAGDEADAVDENRQPQGTDDSLARDINIEAASDSIPTILEEGASAKDVEEAAQDVTVQQKGAGPGIEDVSEGVSTSTPEVVEKELAPEVAETLFNVQPESADEKAPDAAHEAAEEGSVQEVSESPQPDISLSDDSRSIPEDVKVDEVESNPQESVVATPTPCPVDDEFGSLSKDKPEPIDASTIETPEVTNGAQSESVGEETSKDVEESPISIESKSAGEEESLPAEESAIESEIDNDPVESSNAADTEEISAGGETETGDNLQAAEGGENIEEVVPHAPVESADGLPVAELVLGGEEPQSPPIESSREESSSAGAEDNLQAAETGENVEEVVPHVESADEGLPVAELVSGGEEPQSPPIESSLEESSSAGAEDTNEEPGTVEVADKSFDLADVANEAGLLLKTEMTDEEAVTAATEHSVEDVASAQLQTKITDEEAEFAATDRSLDITQLETELRDEEAASAATDRSLDVSSAQLQSKITEEEAVSTAIESSVDETPGEQPEIEIGHDKCAITASNGLLEDTESVKSQCEGVEGSSMALPEDITEDNEGAEVTAITADKEILPSEVSEVADEIGSSSLASIDKDTALDHTDVSSIEHCQDVLIKAMSEPVVDAQREESADEIAVVGGAADSGREALEGETLVEPEVINGFTEAVGKEAAVSESENAQEDEVEVADREMPVLDAGELYSTNEVDKNFNLDADEGVASDEVSSVPALVSGTEEGPLNDVDMSVEVPSSTGKEDAVEDATEKEIVAAPEVLLEEASAAMVPVSSTPLFSGLGDAESQPSKEITVSEEAGSNAVDETPIVTSMQPTLEKEVALSAPRAYNLDAVASSLHDAAESALGQTELSNGMETRSSVAQDVAHIVLEESNKNVGNSKEYISGVVQKVATYAQGASQSSDPNVLPDNVVRAFDGEATSTQANLVTQPQGTTSLGTMLSLFVVWCVSLCASHVESKDMPSPALKLAAEEVASVLHSNGSSQSVQATTSTSH